MCYFTADIKQTHSGFVGTFTRRWVCLKYCMQVAPDYNIFNINVWEMCATTVLLYLINLPQFIEILKFMDQLSASTHTERWKAAFNGPFMAENGDKQWVEVDDLDVTSEETWISKCIPSCSHYWWFIWHKCKGPTQS